MPSRQGADRILARTVARVPNRKLHRSLRSRVRRPIFIIGCARSGTTLVNSLFAAHPEVAVWSEANDVWDPSWYPWRDSGSARPPLELEPQEFTRRWSEENR